MNDSIKKDKSKKWVKVNIPIPSEAYNFLFVYNEETALAKWKLIDKLVTQANVVKDHKDILAEEFFKLYISLMTKIYPERAMYLNQLEELITWQIIQGMPLPKHIFQKLKWLGVDEKTKKEMESRDEKQAKM